MNNKKTKRKLLEEERINAIKHIVKLDAALAGDLDQSELSPTLEFFETTLSFRDSLKWLQAGFQLDTSDIQSRLDELVNVLEKEFPQINPQNAPDSYFEEITPRLIANQILKMYIDNSVILYLLGKIGPAIIELYSVLERRAIEKLVENIFLPEKIEIGFRVVERHTLMDLASRLQDCGILDKEDVKFSERVSRLRNSLAHKNMKKLSNLLASGQDILEVDIDSVTSEINYVEYVIGAINILTKEAEHGNVRYQTMEAIPMAEFAELVQK